MMQYCWCVQMSALCALYLLLMALSARILNSVFTVWRESKSSVDETVMMAMTMTMVIYSGEHDS
jgi:ribose/xylose/arabinose/galactoside ABC-type transport system permease subunit